YDMAVATVVAVALNVSVALISFLASRSEASAYQARAPRHHPFPKGEGRWLIYIVIALSGCTALGAQVVWTRLLSLLLGATVYTFSIILAVFLFGLGIGSCAAALLSQRVGRPRLMLGCCQLLLTAAIAWAAYIIGQVLPYRPIEPTASGSPWVVFEFELLRALLAILPASSLWGASFPLAFAAIAITGDDPARPVAETYAANTI